MTNTLTKGLSKEEKKLLTTSYSINNTIEIFDYLKQNPQLVKIVLEASKEIDYYFLNAQKYLEIKHDPDIENLYKAIISISPTQNFSDVVDKLDEFNDNWWFEASIGIEDLITITIDYR